MKLSGLVPLYSSMKENKINRCKFSISINKVNFEIIYFIDSIPHSLAIGVKEENMFFEVTVKSGFTISTYLGDKYADIYNILGLSPNGTSPFSPGKFYEEINKGIPKSTIMTNIPKSYDIAPYRSDVEESEKIYFLGWKDNDIRNEKVSHKNLEKTRKWLGEEAYSMCKKHNISSCWTAEPSKEKNFTMPLSY